MASKKKPKGVKMATDARSGKRVSAKTAKRRPATTIVIHANRVRIVSHTRRLKRALNDILSTLDAPAASDALDGKELDADVAFETLEEVCAKIKKIAQQALS